MGNENTQTAAPSQAPSIPASTPNVGASAAVASGNSGTAVVSASGQPTSSYAKGRIAAYDRMESGNADASNDSGELSMDDVTGDAPTQTSEPVTPHSTRNPHEDDSRVVDVQKQYETQQRKDAEAAKAAKTKESIANNIDQRQRKQEPVVPAARDYSQFLPEDAEILKQLPNHVFDLAKDRMAQHKRAYDEVASLRTELDRAKQGGLPDNYFNHPQAVTLLPEYQEAAELVSQADAEIGVYENALAAIETGQPYNWISKYDEQGNPVYRRIEPPRDAEGNALIDGAAKAKIMRYMQATMSARENANGQIKQLSKGFGAKHQQAVNDLAVFQKQAFPLFEDPKHAASLEAAAKQLPSYMRSDARVSNFISRGMLLVQMLNSKIAELTSESQRNSTILSDRSAAGPAAALLNAANGGVAQDINQLSMAEFED